MYKILWDLNISWRTWFQTTDRMMDWFACMNAKMNHLPQEKRWVFFHRLKFIFSYSWVKTKMLWVINGNSNVCYTRKQVFGRKSNVEWISLTCIPIWMNLSEMKMCERRRSYVFELFAATAVAVVAIHIRCHDFHIGILFVAHVFVGVSNVKRAAWNPWNQNVMCSVQHCIRTRSVHSIFVVCAR